MKSIKATKVTAIGIKFSLSLCNPLRASVLLIFTFTYLQTKRDSEVERERVHEVEIQRVSKVERESNF